MVEPRKIPEFLYKYLGVPEFGADGDFKGGEASKLRRERFEAVIREPKLWLNSADQFNDPYDCFPEFDFSGLSENESRSMHQGTLHWLACYETEHARNHTDVARRRTQLASEYPYLGKAAAIELAKKYVPMGIRRDIGILCLSEDGTNPVMCYHYAGQSSGLVIKYRVADWFREFEPVEYVKERPVVLFREQSNLPAQFEQIFLHKFHDWGYEREWRYVNFMHDLGEAKRSRAYRSYAPELLCGVSFAPKCSELQKDYVMKLLAERGHRIDVCNLLESRTEFRFIESPFATVSGLL